MYKDIYIIKNYINDKVYIGQAKNVYERWKGHKTAAKTGHYKHRSLLYEAMNRYGVENFYYEILENKVSNYNDREKYWIKEYNSLAPNGYNLLEEGEQYPNLTGIMNAGSAIKDETVLQEVIDDIINSKMSLREIAQKYKVPLNTIHGVNQGRTYFDANLTYPLRSDNRGYKLNKKEVEEICKELNERKLTVKEIAKKFRVSEVTVKNINTRYFYSDILPELVRPIRKETVYKSNILTQEQVDEIIDLIINTSLSYRAIARKYDISHKIVLSIKNGCKSYRKENLKYPLRPNN